MKPVSYRIIAQTTLIVTACSREEAESAAFVHITTAPPVKKTRKPRRRKGEPADATPVTIETSVKLVAAEVVSTQQNDPLDNGHAAAIAELELRTHDHSARAFRPVPMHAGNEDCPQSPAIEHKYEPASLSSP